MRNYDERTPHNPKIGELLNPNVFAVLDGQQRLTASNIGLRGSLAKKLPFKWWSSPDAFPKRYLYLNPSDDDDVGARYQFEFLTPDQAGTRDGCRFRVRDVLTLENSGPAMTEWLEKCDLGGRPLSGPYKVLNRLFGVVRNLLLVVFYEERSQELERVLQIFIRTNSGGTVPSYSDLLLSVAVAHGLLQTHERRFTDWLTT